jgi:hypothetical protein
MVNARCSRSKGWKWSALYSVSAIELYHGGAPLDMFEPVLAIEAMSSPRYACRRFRPIVNIYCAGLELFSRFCDTPAKI